MRALGLVLVASCISYNEGSFHDHGAPFVGRRVALDCVDVAIAPTQDASAQGQVLAFTFGNHCSSSISIDFAKVAAVGRYADGTRKLHAYDPNHELRALRIDAGNVGHEEIAYLADDGTTPAATCVDVGGLETTEQAPEHWVCFGEWDVGSNVVGATPPAIHAAGSTKSWPMRAELEPEVLELGYAGSIAQVGEYFAEHIRGDPRRLVKALHDYVVRRITYDTFSRMRPDLRLSQDADAVFARRTGVCEGYANLLVALGAAAGVDIVEIDGFAHSETAPGTPEPEGELHAWNAAHVDDGWVLLDATWDDDGTEPESTYYLMTPPGIFARSHVAVDPQWQLVAPELTLGEFVTSR